MIFKRKKVHVHDLPSEIKQEITVAEARSRVAESTAEKLRSACRDHVTAVDALSRLVEEMQNHRAGAR